MTAEQLLNPLVISFIFCVAAIVKFQKDALHEVFSYLVVAGWFFNVWLYPGMTVETVRVIGRWAVVQIAIVVIFFHLGTWWFRRQYKNVTGAAG